MTDGIALEPFPDLVGTEEALLEGDLVMGAFLCDLFDVGKKWVLEKKHDDIVAFRAKECTSPPTETYTKLRETCRELLPSFVRLDRKNKAQMIQRVIVSLRGNNVQGRMLKELDIGFEVLTDGRLLIPQTENERVLLLNADGSLQATFVVLTKLSTSRFNRARSPRITSLIRISRVRWTIANWSR